MKTRINYLLALVAVLCFSYNTQAQRFNVESIKMDLEDQTITDADRDFEQLLKWSDETLNHPKTSNDPKMWYYRGLLFIKVAGLNNEFSEKYPDAIKTALNALNKAIETDVKNKVTKQAKANLLNVAIGLYNTGYNAYKSEDYDQAYEDFSLALPLMEYDVDGLLKQNNLTAEVLEQMMGFSALNGGNDNKAKTAFENLISNGSIEPTVFANLASIHLKQGDTTKALDVINNGNDIIGSDKTLTNMKLNIYLQQGKSQVLVDELNEAIANDPGNVIYYFARAGIYEGLGETDKAVADYDKAIEIDPSYYDAYYNKGVLYLDRVAKIVDELDGVYKPSIIEVKEAEIMENYKLAIVEFETVFEENMDMPIDEKVKLADTMKRIYSRLERMDKYADMKAFIEQNQ